MSSMPVPRTAPRTRMSADDRRAQVLAAATRAFARTGYAGTSTDAVAREAGVSQPYVVRMFGTKLDLFLAVFDRATDRVKAAFTAVVDGGAFDPDRDEEWAKSGTAYTEVSPAREALIIRMVRFLQNPDSVRW